jgi:uncharacterized protein (TIGR01777 family)
MRRVVVAGATGFVGRALCASLAGGGWSVVAAVRGSGRRFAHGVSTVPLADGDAVRAALDGAAAVVNLAGAPVAATRWTPAVRREIVASRVDVTARLVALAAAAAAPPPTWVQGSAIGYYGSTPGRRCAEDAPPGDDFLARVCVDWEAAAEQAAARWGARVVQMRTSVVIGADGGALQRLLPLFSAGLGGRVGSGEQPFAWVHIDDAVTAFRCAAEEVAWAGAVNLAVEDGTTSASFAAALGRALGRPAALPAPAWALRLAFGEGASVVLGGQAVSAARLHALGFKPRFATLAAALDDVVRKWRSTTR